jgi:hypothetical protein
VLANSPTLTTPNIGTATGSVSGNAGTATALQTARTINGVSFDGTANITAGLTALTGDVTASGNGSQAATVVNLPTGVTAAGRLLFTAIAEPATPSAGVGSVYIDATSKNLCVKDDAGIVKHGVQTKAAVSNSFVTAISDAGVVSVAQPAVGDISGFGTGVATFLATPSSANLAAAVTDETGTGALVFATSPTLVTPALGTPSALVLTNATGLTESGQTLADVTTLDVSTTKHGYAPKLPNDATKYLDGTGAYSVPAGGGSSPFTSSAGVVTFTTSTDRLQLVAGSSSTVPLTVKAAASQTANMAVFQNSSGTAFLTIGPPSPGASDQFLYITGTMANASSGNQFGMSVQVTPQASSGSARPFAVYSYLAPGYTATSGSFAGFFDNFSAGTGTKYLNNQDSIDNSDWCNIGFGGGCNSTTTGTNVGCFGYAKGGNVGIGVVGKSVAAKNSAKNVGVAGFGLNTGTSPVQVGGFFGLMAVEPTYASAALMCDNGSTTSDIFVVRDNGTNTFVIGDGGTVGFHGVTPVGRQTYTPSNVSADRSFDANATTLDELADVVGTIIADLQAVGLMA